MILAAIASTEEVLQLKNYSQATKKAYLSCIRTFLECSQNDALLHQAQITSFILQKRREGLSGSTTNLYLQSIKFYPRHVLRMPTEFQIPLAKRPKRLPVILTRDDILRILESISNVKHKTMIALAYGAGLRVSEVVAIRIRDLDIASKMILVPAGKGQKDRMSVLPVSLIDDLENLSSFKPPNGFLFESERGGKLSTRTAQIIFFKGVQKGRY